MLKGIISDWASRLRLKEKFLLSFIILTICSYGILYSIVHANYFNVIIKQRELSTGQLLAAMEINLDAFYNELFTMSNAISINPLITSVLFEQIEITEAVEEDITRKLEYKLANRPYMQGIRLYKGEHVFMSIYQGHSMIDSSLNRLEWEINNPGNEKMQFIPTYKKRYEKTASESPVKTDYQYEERIFTFVRVIENIYGEEIGAIAIDVQENYFHDLYDGMRMTPNSQNMIISPTGYIISATDKSWIGPNQYREMFDLMKAAEGGFVYEFNGAKNLIVYNTYSRFNWKLVSGIPLNDMHLFKKTFNQLIAVFLTIFILANIILSVVVSRVLIKPLGKILDAITRIRKADFNIEINHRYKDEIGIIADNLTDMAHNIDSLIKENYLIKLREQEAEIKSLQAQINPHFLYNTLDTISWKVMLMGGEDISKVINCLGEILRYNIRQSTRIVSLAEELKQVENYLFIQNIRYEDRFVIEYDISPESLDLQIHKLMIQPLIENAIQHGLEELTEGGLLRISTRIKNEHLLITIHDNGKGIPTEKIPRLIQKPIPTNQENKNNHIGIFNVHKRIQHYYGEEYGIIIESAVNRYTDVMIRIPAIKISRKEEIVCAKSSDC